MNPNQSVFDLVALDGSKRGGFLGDQRTGILLKLADENVWRQLIALSLHKLY